MIVTIMLVGKILIRTVDHCPSGNVFPVFVERVITSAALVAFMSTLRQDVAGKNDTDGSADPALVEETLKAVA